MRALRSLDRDLRLAVRTGLLGRLRSLVLFAAVSDGIDPLDDQEDHKCHDDEVYYRHKKASVADRNSSVEQVE